MKFYVRCAFCLPTAVKTRILGLALDLEKLNPEAGEPGSPATDAAAVTTVVYNHIYGDGNNIAVASHDVRQHIERVREGDVDSLIDALKRLGTTNGDVQTLQQAIGCVNRSGTQRGGLSRTQLVSGRAER